MAWQQHVKMVNEPNKNRKKFAPTKEKTLCLTDFLKIQIT
jgi:hypothetical protein